MKVKDIMSSDVKTASPDTLVKDIAQTMCFHRISGLPIVDDENNILGIISEKDVLNKMFPDIAELASQEKFPNLEELEGSYAGTLQLKAKELMTTSVATVSPEMPILKATSMMCIKKIRRIPVAKEGKLIGIISVGDVHKAIFLSTIGT